MSEDGLIDHLIKISNLQTKTFIEFGVEDYQETNTRFLLEGQKLERTYFDSSDKIYQQDKKMKTITGEKI